MSKKKAQRVEQKVEQSQQDPQESSEVVEQGSTTQGSTSSGTSVPESSTLPTSSESQAEDQDKSPDQNPSSEEPNPIPPDARPAGMRSLKCILTEDERSAYGMALAQFVTELEALEVQKANIPQQIKAVRERMRDTKCAMQNGYEFRDVDCYERDHGPTIEIVRADTGEVVDVRAAKLDDRQTTIFDALNPDADNPLDGEPEDESEDDSEDGEPFTETDGEPESTPDDPDDPEDLF